MPIVEKEVKVTVTEPEYVGFQCDSCGDVHHKDNHVETQEAFHYRSTSGYGSLIGDGTYWTVSLCQKCFLARLGDCIVIEKEI